jgi:CRISPR-associated endoribonuclease Cas6
MRVRLIFDLLNIGAKLPFHHQYLISDFMIPYINHYLKSIKEPSKICYNFSALKGQIKVTNEGVYFNSSKVSLVFSSNDPLLVESLIHQLYKKTTLALGDLLLSPATVDMENPMNYTSEMKYLCLSPLAIISPIENPIDAKRFIHPSYDTFSDALYENTMNRMEQSGSTPAEIAQYFQFQLMPDKEYLNKIKGEEKKFARIHPIVINEEKYEVRGYTFPFTLYAHPKVQEFIFTCGFGVFTDKGFGMVDIANSDHGSRTIPYFLKKELEHANYSN